MAPTGCAPTEATFDGKGFIWSVVAVGALRLRSGDGEFIAFKSVTYKTDNGTA